MHFSCSQKYMANPRDLFAQVEKLLEEVDASAGSSNSAGALPSPEALDSRVRLYERVNPS